MRHGQYSLALSAVSQGCERVKVNTDWPSGIKKVGVHIHFKACCSVFEDRNCVKLGKKGFCGIRFSSRICFRTRLFIIFTPSPLRLHKEVVQRASQWRAELWLLGLWWRSIVLRRKIWTLESGWDRNLWGGLLTSYWTRTRTKIQTTALTTKRCVSTQGQENEENVVNKCGFTKHKMMEHYGAKFKA